MTSQIDRADNNPMAHEGDHAVRVDDRPAPEDDLAMPGEVLAMPGEDLAMPGDDLALRDEPVSHGFATSPAADSKPAADSELAADSEPAASAVSGFPGFTPDGEGAGQPGIGIGSPDYVALSPAADAAASPVDGLPPADNPMSAAAPWKEIQATFVDDPRASTERAAGLVDDRVRALVTAVRNRQQVLESAWHAGDSGTEELRKTLQHYRAFWHRLEDFPTE